MEQTGKQCLPRERDHYQQRSDNLNSAVWQYWYFAPSLISIQRKFPFSLPAAGAEAQPAFHAPPLQPSLDVPVVTFPLLSAISVAWKSPGCSAWAFYRQMCSRGDKKSKGIRTLPDTVSFARVLLPSCVHELLRVDQGRLGWIQSHGLQA